MRGDFKMKTRILLVVLSMGLMACSKMETASSPIGKSSIAAARAMSLKGASIKSANQMPVTDPESIQDVSSPCRPFRLACVSAGFMLQNATAGNRLIADCIEKLIDGQSAVSPVSKQSALAPSGADAKSCAVHIHHGNKPTTGSVSPVIPTYAN
jgi:hypothetical protein